MKFLRNIAPVCLLLPLTVGAEEIAISFEAVVDWEDTNVQVLECLGLEQGVNDTITGFYIYSTLDEDGNPVPDLNWDRYIFQTEFTTAPNSMFAEVNNFWFTSNPADTQMFLELWDHPVNAGGDLYAISSSRNLTNNDCNFNLPPDPGAITMYMLLIDFEADALNSEDPATIPTTTPILEDWDQGGLVHIGYYLPPVGYQLFGDVTSIERVNLDIQQALGTLFEYEDLPLQPEQVTALHQKVTNAMIKIDRGQVDQGCQQLSGFICQLEALLPMFEQTEGYDLANAILDTAYDIFGAQCSVTEPVVMECAKWETD